MKSLDIFGIKNKEIKLIGTSLKLENYPLEFCIYPSLNKNRETRKIIEEKLITWISFHVALEKLISVDDEIYNKLYREWDKKDNELRELIKKYRIENFRIRILEKKEDIKIFDSEQTKYRKIYYKIEYEKILLFAQKSLTGSF